MDINFEYYKIFYFAAKYGNITKAAAALGSSQPNVTRVIRQLESQLGRRLFIREPRGIRLTGDGERLYVHAEAACAHLFKAQEELGASDPEASGTIDIGATETALHLLFFSAMQGFRMIYPDIRIRVHNHSTPEILKRFASGELDFAADITWGRARRTPSAKASLPERNFLMPHLLLHLSERGSRTSRFAQTVLALGNRT